MPISNLKLAQKGLALVSSLLLLEMLFVASLVFLLNEAEQEAEREARSKLVTSKTNRIIQLYYDGADKVGKLGFSATPELLRLLDGLVSEISQEIRDLKDAVRDRPQELAIVLRIERNSNVILNAFRKLKATVQQRSLVEAAIEFAREKQKFDPILLGEMVPDVNQLIKLEKKVIDESPKRQSESRTRIKNILYVGLGLNILAAILIALLFVRGITRRLQILVDNTKRLAEGKPLNAIVGGSDEIAQLDRVFHKMADQLAEIQQMRRAFVAMVSHELRTPLTSVHGFLSLTTMGALGEASNQVMEGARVAERNIERLIKLINDLLDLEKIEAGQLNMTFKDAQLSDVIERSVEAVINYADKNEVALDVHDTAAHIYADADRLVQVVVNLLANAIKFSPRDSVVTLDVVEDDRWVEVRVIDRGRGIPSQFKESVFDRFQQVEASDSTQKGGTGLGLAICKAIIEQHGGTISVDSEEGKGSTFYFRLPVRELTVAPAEAAGSEQSGQTILSPSG